MKLQANVGPIDRIIRMVLGVGLVAVALSGSVAAPLPIAVWIVAAIALVTGAIGFCPLYHLLGISTTGNRAATSR
ncbi:MAG: YgaP family membrane protein [Candidatus Limnocylindrales bacterium]